MSFETKKIRKINWNKKKKNLSEKVDTHINKIGYILNYIFKYLNQKKINRNNISIVFISLLLIFCIYGAYKIITLANSFSIREIVLSVFSQKIKTDEFNHTNFLIAGIGGDNHDGGELTDTIKVVSIDHSNKYITMISIPRDLWVKNEYGGNKINELFMLKKQDSGSEIEGMNFLASKITDITGLNINYSIKIDFKSFEQLVDVLGCVNVNVKESIYDPEYPKDGTYLYETFKIDAGPQCIDGKTALKYARSRHASAGGDLSRSERQADLIKAIKNEAISQGLTKPTKLKELYDVFRQNVYTDLTFDELVYLAKISSDFSSNNILSVNINDVPYEKGGFLYVPSKEQYGGFVFLPSYVSPNKGEEFKEINTFIDFITKQTAIYQDATPLHILNGTKSPGLAADLLYTLSRYGLDIVRYGNATDRETTGTVVYVKTKFDEQGNPINEDFEKDPLIKYIRNFIPENSLVMSTTNTQYDSSVFDSKAEYIIVLGSDFLDFKKENPGIFYYWN